MVAKGKVSVERGGRVVKIRRKVMGGKTKEGRARRREGRGRKMGKKGFVRLEGRRSGRARRGR